MSDDVAILRARMGLLARIGQWAGYLIFLSAIIIFVIGLLGNFSNTIAKTLVLLLVIGSAILAPTIVLHHGVQAAIRDEAATTKKPPNQK